MKNRLKLALIATTSLFLTSGLAMAQGTQTDTREPRGQRGFEHMDADSSGSVSLDEFTTLRAGHFGNMDKDGDGTVTRAEISAFGAMRAERMAERLLERFDADGSGMIEEGEFEAATAERFSRMDKDGNGELSADEFADGRVRGPGHRRLGEQDTRMRHHERQGQMGAREHASGDEKGPFGFSRLDRDGNGELTSAEFTSAAEARFARLDENGDGIVTPDEMRNARRADWRMGHGRNQ